MASLRDAMSFFDAPHSSSSSSHGFRDNTPGSNGHHRQDNTSYNNKRSKELEEDDDRRDDDGEIGADGKRKKHKFTRSRTACLQCRSRKSKCGALPPAPCPNCVEAGLPCQWPAEDGRSSKARMQRAKGRTSADGIYGLDVKPDTSAHSIEAGQGGGTWLDQLLQAGAIVDESDQSPFTSNYVPQVNARTVSNSVGSVPGPSSGPMYSGNIPSQGQPGIGLPQTSNLFSNFAPNQFPSSMDPAQFIWAVSSRLPTVEESSPFDQSSHQSGPSPHSASDPNWPKKTPKQKQEEGKIVKVTWWRPHGQTAIAPGLKRITLKVRVDRPQDPWHSYSPRPALQGPNDVPQEVISQDGAPSTPIMRHLLDVFMLHFGCQYPFLDKASLEQKIEARTGSVFLLNSIAAIAARFSTHPAIALPELQPYDYGNVFYNRAKALLGSMLAVPSRETVASFILLASCGFANDSESEVWMMTGLAVRMSIDLGLHLDPPVSSNISNEERRLNRLVFWSILLMDYALAFGVGRLTTYRVEEITQPIPTQDDVTLEESDAPRSPFPFCAQMMISYGPLINMLNMDQTETLESEISSARSAAIKEYNQLPADMQWNVGNLQRHSRANQASAFLHLHLWMHTILASGYLTGSDIPRRASSSHKASKSGAATPNSSTASNLWRNSARTIGDILVLSDIINPLSYCALPFVNQAFFVAGCCYVKEIEQTKNASMSPANSPRRVPASLTMSSTVPSRTNERHGSDNSYGGNNGNGAGASSGGGTEGGKHVDLSRALLTSVATTNIQTLQQGLAKQNTYWQGTAWISSALKQRIEGMPEVDLVGVTEKLASSVSLPDAGLVGRKNNGDGNGGGGGASAVAAGRGDGHDGLDPFGQTPNLDWMTFTPGPPTGETHSQHNFSDMDFLASLPFDVGTVEGGSQNVTEQEVPLQSFDSQWFR